VAAPDGADPAANSAAHDGADQDLGIVG
jgi:hypothetical protein